MENGFISPCSSFTLVVQPDQVGQRIDMVMTRHFEQYSRSFLQKLFEDENVIINNSKKIKPSYRLRDNDSIVITIPEQSTTRTAHAQAQHLAITVLAKHDDFLIIEKPAGVVVHPPNHNYQQATLADWIIQTHEDIAHVGLIDRPGIVHRLDKETSGLMIIPRTNCAHATFTEMFKNRAIKKTYLALVVGHPPASGTIKFFIDRHPTVRNKMHHFTAANKRSLSRHAQTDYQVLQYFKEHALVQAQPLTGRTHQIRVHLTAIGNPLLSDSVYGKKSKLLSRHALHAHKLEFEYKGKSYSFTSPIAKDIQESMNDLILK